MSQPIAGSPRAELARLASPPLRADARRNYEAVLAAAAEVFGAGGPDASLDEIARRAGVGNATLYRHFPHRRDLLIAVCVDEVEKLCVIGEELRSQGHGPSGDALESWLHAYIDHVRTRSGLGAAFATGNSQDSPFVATCRAAVGEVGSALLRDAQQAGTARADLRLDDLLTLANAIAIVTESSTGDQARDLLKLVMEGVRPR
ncbi:TetR/AcrR family transcriptional regulator [Streptomyces sp. TS71-3]|uniref:TetR/AcrR family transcriptional regulator n=1 Tax=Streptomyces sp. TS71-3 TaxID=2733862 RepID=UPI001B24147E|nr:TetR/AcrR family transcriptional regulator [Streptomyces sp. TS71-3]GHJ39940.1 TetR family transcriptional regulator [Streptomyces sp. TS71-3]